jgi:hypothetical protein
VHPIAEMEARALSLSYTELAIAVSEPVDEAAVRRLADAARRVGRPVAITTTIEVAEAHPALFDGLQRLNLSVDPWKIAGDAAAVLASVEAAARAAKQTAGLEVIALATLSTPTFATLLVEGELLAAMVDSPVLDGVALSALKPPPPFCDRAFWLRTLAQLGPLLDRTLDRRLFLDCYVAARLLKVGPCPGRADLSPSARGVAFRSCVYAATPDLELEAGQSLPPYLAPEVCPFDTRLDGGVPDRPER